MAEGLKDRWDEEHDVVVVGSGAGALTGAYLAARDGLDTVVLEKADRLGGTSAYSGAACWLPGTQVQDAGRWQRLVGLDARVPHGRARRCRAREGRGVRQHRARAGGRGAGPRDRVPAATLPRPLRRVRAGAAGPLDRPVDLAPTDLGDLLALVRPPAERDHEGLDGRGDDEFDCFFAVGQGHNPALVPLDQPPYVAARVVLS